MNTIDKKYMLGMDLSNRKFGLDILRALAIIFVLLAHSNFSFLSDSVQSIINASLFDGVNIFFVLSGFLIGSILIKTIDKSDFKVKGLIKFWRNRWLRTLPPYYFILIIVFWVPRYFDFPVENSYLGTELKIRYVFFLQNFKTPYLGFFNESWSLAVEEWFYILIPIILFTLCTILKFNLKRSLIFVILLGICFSLGYRMYSFYVIFSSTVDADTFDYYFRYLVLTRLDGIMYGVLGAYVYYFHSEIWSRKSNLGLIIGLILICVNQMICVYFSVGNISSQELVGSYICCYSYSVFSISILLMMPYMVQMKPPNNSFIYRSITFISLISYSMYLLNFSLISMLIMPVLEECLNLNGFFHIIIFWTITIFLSALMFRVIEKPSMDLRKILFKK